MHEIHAILVQVPDFALTGTPEELVEAAQEEAEGLVDPYYEQAWDRRECLTGEEADDAGLPCSVIVGQTQPDLLFTTIEAWADKPLNAALSHLDDARTLYKDSYTTIDADLLRQVWHDGRHPVPVVEDVAWPRQRDRDLRMWHLIKALQLASGLYLVESQFFSGPDGSPQLQDETWAAVRAHPERYALVFLDYHW